MAIRGWLYAKITETTQVWTGEAILHGMVVVDDDTNVATVKAYDNAAAASGSQPAPDVITLGDAQQTGNVGFDPYINNGIHVTVSTAGTCTVWVFYRPRD